jgi:hypothetical protein
VFRKYCAGVAVTAAAAVLFVPPALAGAKAHDSKASVSKLSLKDTVVVRTRRNHHQYMVRKHYRRNTEARVASCPAGNLSANYCTPPTLDSLFGSFSTGGSATYGSNNTTVCKDLGYKSAPCGVYTSTANELIVAYVSADGPSTGGQTLSVTCTSSSGGTCPVTFHKLASENAAKGDSEVWYADASSVISQSNPIFVTTTPGTDKCTVQGKASTCDVNMDVVTYENAITPGAAGAQGIGIGNSAENDSSSGAPTVSVTTSEPDSWVWAVGNDWANTKALTVGSNQTAIEVIDQTAGKAFWLQTTNSYTAASGTKVTINDTAPTSDPFNYVGVEIL